MNAHRYRLCLTGLREHEGQIKASRLVRVVDALIKMAESATCFLATGEGSRRGPRPAWLQASVDFTITGQNPGSTVLDIEAPHLGETAHEKFFGGESRPEQPRLDDTAIDLAALAIEEARAGNSQGDRFDSAVLEAILKFKEAGGNTGVCYELVPQGTARGRFKLADNVAVQLNQRLNSMMAPKAFVVSGRLDDIQYGGRGGFRLLLPDGRRLPGRLHPEFLDIEVLRPLWGKRVTVEGTVHFRANGLPQFIKARRVSRFADGDDCFEETPTIDSPGPQGLTPAQERQARSANFMELWGSWPGDEPIDELLAQLD